LATVRPKKNILPTLNARFRYLGEKKELIFLKIKDPPVLDICGQINIKEPLALLFQKRTRKEMVVLGGNLAFFFTKKKNNPLESHAYIRTGYFNF
jgi:hypothetical protein